ncbi:unnamed protein product [Brachionus calyciflorus]|uniref:EGF-like domain-containing protein n=1 Tax=Brachionus calyciflorus TaxID=104777 RepID=A0A814IJL8_9BILA|nr:unnamed protein product [Brachionus calyciflorus]
MVVFMLFLGLVHNLFFVTTDGQKLYKFEKDKSILNDTGLLEIFTAKSKWTCLKECNKNINCVLVVYFNTTCKIFDSTSWSNKVTYAKSSIFINSACLSNLCVNGDNCKNESLNFICECPQIYKGITCYKKFHNESIRSLIILSNGYLVTGSTDKTMSIWNTTSYTLVKRLSYNQSIFTVFELSNDILASGTYSGSIVLWNMTSWNITKIFKPHSLAIRKMIKLPNGNLITASSDFKIKIWDSNFSLILQNNHSHYVIDILILPSGNLISCSCDNSIIIWNLNNLSVIHQIFNHTVCIISLTLLNNGDFVTGSHDYTIKIWDSNEYFLKKVFNPYRIIYSLGTLPNGYLVAGDGFGQVRIWSLINWKEIKNIRMHTARVFSLVNTPDGELVSGDENGVLIIWNKNFLLN